MVETAGRKRRRSELKEDFLDIVAVIVRQMSEWDGPGMKGRHILEGLLDEGYDIREIDDALSWMESLAGAAEELGGVEFSPGFKGVRTLAPIEREVMTQDAFSYLNRLQRAGILDESLREALMDKVCELDIPGFGVEHMKALLGLVLYSRKSLPVDDFSAWDANRWHGSRYDC